MILDIIVARATTEVKRHGKLPQQIKIVDREAKFNRTIKQSSIEGVFKHLLKMNPGVDITRNPESLLQMLNGASVMIHKARRRKGLTFLVDSRKQRPEALRDSVRILDMREGKNAINGVVQERIMSIMNCVSRKRNQRESYQAIKTLRSYDLVITENKSQALQLQYFLALRGVLTLAVSHEELEGVSYNVPECELWSEPFAVGEQSK